MEVIVRLRFCVVRCIRVIEDRLPTFPRHLDVVQSPVSLDHDRYDLLEQAHLCSFIRNFGGRHRNGTVQTKIRQPKQGLVYRLPLFLRKHNLFPQGGRDTTRVLLHLAAHFGQRGKLEARLL